MAVRLDPFQNIVNVSWGAGGRYFIIGGFQYAGDGSTIAAPIFVIKDDGSSTTYKSAVSPGIVVDVPGNPAVDGDDNITDRYLNGDVAFTTPLFPQAFDRAGNLYVFDSHGALSKLSKTTGELLGTGTAVGQVFGDDVDPSGSFFTLAYDSGASQVVIQKISLSPDIAGWIVRTAGFPIGGNPMGVDAKGDVWAGIITDVAANACALNKYDGKTGALLFSIAIPAAETSFLTYFGDPSDPGVPLSSTITNFSPGLIAVDTDGKNGVAVVDHGGTLGSSGFGGGGGGGGGIVIPPAPSNLNPPTLNSYGPTGSLNWSVPIMPPDSTWIGGPSSVAAVKNTVAVVGAWETPAIFATIHQKRSFVTGYSTRDGSQLWTKTGATPPGVAWPQPYSGTLPGEYGLIFRSPH